MREVQTLLNSMLFLNGICNIGQRVSYTEKFLFDALCKCRILEPFPIEIRKAALHYRF